MVSDSRGRHLDDWLPHNDGVQYMVVPCDSQGLISLSKKAVMLSKSIPPDMVYLYGGICDVTLRNFHTKKTTLRWNDPRFVVENYINTAETAFELLRNSPSTANCKIVFCPLVGIHLNRYNKVISTTPHHQQGMLDEIIVRINRFIIWYMSATTLRTPW